jgi:enediyne biosynthesis protein E4
MMSRLQRCVGSGSAHACMAALMLCIGCGQEADRTPSAQSSPTDEPDVADPIVDQPDASTAPTDEGTPEHPQRFRMTDVARDAGIDMTLTSGTWPATQIIEVKGGGIALIDYNNNGRLDIFIPNGATMDDTESGPGCRLYENLGDMTFRDATAQAGLDLTRWAMGVAVADFDADGFDDIFICCFGRNVLYRNNGDGTFADITEQSGLGDDESWSTSAAFADLDGDGWLDLYVANYLEFDVANPPPPATFRGETVFAGPRGLPARHDLLYRNRGDGTFENVSESSGIRSVEPGYGLGVVALDFTGDGQAEIFVGNDSQPNFLFTRTDDWTYEDVGTATGIATNLDGLAQATMGIGIADVDGSGTPDVFTTNFASDTNTLHLNLDGRFFDDRTKQFGLGVVSRPFLGWACGFYDFDHDGDEDLVIFNGHVYPDASRATMDSDLRQPPLLFAREGARFERVTDEAAGTWLTTPHLDRSACFGDLNGDGAIDIVVGELGGPIRVLRNDGAAGDWVIIELRDNRDDARNRRGIGARVVVTDGPRRHTRWITSGGFQSANAQYAHVGLGDHNGDDGLRTIDLHITWPDGHEQSIRSVAVNRHHVIMRQPQ